MSLIFAGIFREGQILVEYTTHQGNFEQLALTISKKCTGGKVSFQEREYVYHTLYDRGFVYICMTDISYMKADAYSFLEALQKILQTKCPDEISKTSVAFGLNNKLRDDIKKKYELYNSPDASKFRKAQTQLDSTKDIVLKNLDKVLERSERLELLVEKSSNMNVQASKMKAQAVSIRRQQQCKKIKLWVLIGFCLLVAIYLILVLSCGGFALKNCTGGGSSDDEKKNSNTKSFLGYEKTGNNIKPASGQQCLASMIQQTISSFFEF